jgi:hypothetical protein
MLVEPQVGFALPADRGVSCTRAACLSGIREPRTGGIHSRGIHSP